MRITLCGSIAFYDEMLRVKTQLEEAGYEVKLPPFEIKNDKGEMISVKKYYEMRKMETSDTSWIWDQKARSIHEHFDKITWSDAILVTNYDKKGIVGYIGGNTLMEMGLAFHLGKKIYLLNQMPEMQYKEEIIGLRPKVIFGDLSKIK